MLELPTDPRTAAFKAVVRRLKDDPVLSRVIRKWHNQHPPGPSLAELPYVVIGLKAGGISVGSPQAHNNSLIVGVDYVVNAAGTDEETAWQDIINLYGQIEKAVNPFGDIAWLRDSIHAVDSSVVVQQVTFTQAGYTTIPMDGVNCIGASCVFSVPLKINTCRS
jgi:hypothetical protein